jgi:2-keto-4-pentenoate hydratase/2-oxohepta-3-ene-1,7-dioic acid hydratase in catechol pathway
MKKISIPGTDLTPRSIYCIGRNYIEHAKELDNPVPSSPLVFLKPQSALCFNGDEIIIPEQSSDVHHEVEIVVAISKSGKNISEEAAQDYIAGIGIGIDFTARDIQHKAKQSGNPWTIAKGFDTFAPISTFLPLNEIEDLNDIELSLSVNGVTKQVGNSSQMIFSIPFLISYLSEIFTLHPGDLIFTGTPSGVSQVKAGDKIEATLGNKFTTLSVSVK